jgi:hypothetical protein
MLPPTIRHVSSAHSRGLQQLGRALLAALALLAVLLTGSARADGPVPAPPPLSILQPDTAAGDGYAFIAPKLVGPTARGPQGPEIVDGQGRPVWFNPVPSEDEQATDFRVQTYRGRPVLTWWQGNSHEGPGHGQGFDYVADSSYRIVARVAAANGLDADSHEFRLTDRGTALITSYHTVPYDLSPLGGPVDGKVYDGIVQELDVATGRVLLEWHSLDHVPLTDSYQPVPRAAGTPYDYFHINAVNPDGRGGLLVSARHTWTVYDLDRNSGAVRWRLGGKHSDFALGNGVQFRWQHNPLAAGRDTIRIFDNASNGNAPVEASRVIWVQLDQARRRASLVRSFTHPAGLSAPSQGNSQQLGGDRTFVGWGQLGRISEIDGQGNLLFDAQLPPGFDTYRAYRSRWVGTPTARPTATVDTGGTTVHAIWNGATQVRSWVVLGGRGASGRDARRGRRAHRARPARHGKHGRHGRHGGRRGRVALGRLRGHGLRPIAQTAWNGLDTPIAIPSGVDRVRVVALDGRGRTLGSSAVTPTR